MNTGRQIRFATQMPLTVLLLKYLAVRIHSILTGALHYVFETLAAARFRSSEVLAAY